MMGFTLPPLLGWAFGHLLPADFRIGLLVMCYGPCTLASAVIWTRLARGDEASAILATMLSSGVGWLVTPALLELTLGASIAVDYPAMMRDLALTLVLPVALGQAVRALPPFTQVARKYRIALDVLSRLLVLVVLFGAARGLAETMREPGRLDGPALLACVAACLAVHLVALAAAWLAAAGCRIERAGRIAVALAGSQKTLPVALVVLDLYFSGQPLAVVPLVLYHAGQLVADTLLAERWAGNLASPEDFARV
jgi:sodium/bile acid cotransporter 7